MLGRNYKVTAIAPNGLFNNNKKIKNEESISTKFFTTAHQPETWSLPCDMIGQAQQMLPIFCRDT